MFLQCVELIKLLLPKFVTVEEVPDFLSKTLPLDYRIGKDAGSETVSTPCILLGVVHPPPSPFKGLSQAYS